MEHWIFSCRKISRMVSDSMDRKLPLGQRVGIAMHLLICKFCTRYKKQLHAIRKAVRLFEKDAEKCNYHAELPEDAKARIKEAMMQSNENSV